MNYIKMFKTNKKTFLIGIVLIFILLIIFISQKIKPSSTIQQPSFKMEEQIGQTVSFYTKVIGNQAKTQVYIPFSFKTDSFPLVLGYKLEDQTMKEFLIFHPQLSFIDWYAIKDNGLTLYQKEIKYDSLSEFLKNPSGNIATESNLKRKYPQLNAELVHFSNDSPIDFEKYDYILSTQVHLSQSNNTYYYKNIIDTSDALIDENNKITWVVRAPDADKDHRFYLGGNIEIVYLQ